MDQKHPYHNAICGIERRVDTSFLRCNSERAPCGAIHAHGAQCRSACLNDALEIRKPAAGGRSQSECKIPRWSARRGVPGTAFEGVQFCTVFTSCLLG